MSYVNSGEQLYASARFILKVKPWMQPQENSVFVSCVDIRATFTIFNKITFNKSWKEETHNAEVNLVYVPTIVKFVAPVRALFDNENKQKKILSRTELYFKSHSFIESDQTEYIR